MTSNDNFVVFHTAVDDSYMNSTANFRGADVTGNTEITMYFQNATSSSPGGGMDSVVLNINAGKEIEVMEALAGAMRGSARKAFTVIADDINSVYCSDQIADCGAITVLGGNKKIVENITNTDTLYAYDSGKVFTIDQDAAFTITLPADSAGLHYTFLLTDAGSNDVKIDGGGSNAIKGFAMDVTGTINAVDNNMVKFVSGVSVVGDIIRLVNDGTTWWCEALASADGGIVGANS